MHVWALKLWNNPIRFGLALYIKVSLKVIFKPKLSIQLFVLQINHKVSKDFTENTWKQRSVHIEEPASAVNSVVLNQYKISVIRRKS